MSGKRQGGEGGGGQGRLSQGGKDGGNAAKHCGGPRLSRLITIVRCPEKVEGGSIGLNFERGA